MQVNTLACLTTNKHADLCMTDTDRHSCLSIHIHSCIQTSTYTYSHLCMFVYIYTYIITCKLACIYLHMSGYIHKLVHVCLHKNRSTCIHYICTDSWMCLFALILTGMHTQCIHIYILIHRYSWMFVYLYTYILTCNDAYTCACPATHIHLYIHAHLPTYKDSFNRHTCITNSFSPRNIHNFRVKYFHSIISIFLEL